MEITSPHPPKKDFFGGRNCTQERELNGIVNCSIQVGEYGLQDMIAKVQSLGGYSNRDSFKFKTPISFLYDTTKKSIGGAFFFFSLFFVQQEITKKEHKNKNWRRTHHTVACKPGTMPSEVERGRGSDVENNS